MHTEPSNIENLTELEKNFKEFIIEPDFLSCSLFSEPVDKIKDFLEKWHKEDLETIQKDNLELIAKHSEKAIYTLIKNLYSQTTQVGKITIKDQPSWSAITIHCMEHIKPKKENDANISFFTNKYQSAFELKFEFKGSSLLLNHSLSPIKYLFASIQNGSSPSSFSIFVKQETPEIVLKKISAFIEDQTYKLNKFLEIMDNDIDEKIKASILTIKKSLKESEKKLKAAGAKRELKNNGKKIPITIRFEGKKVFLNDKLLFKKGEIQTKVLAYMKETGTITISDFKTLKQGYRRSLSMTINYINEKAEKILGFQLLENIKYDDGYRFNGRFKPIFSQLEEHEQKQWGTGEILY